MEALPRLEHFLESEVFLLGFLVGTGLFEADDFQERKLDVNVELHFLDFLLFRDLDTHTRVVEHALAETWRAYCGGIVGFVTVVCLHLDVQFCRLSRSDRVVSFLAGSLSDHFDTLLDHPQLESCSSFSKDWLFLGAVDLLCKLEPLQSIRIFVLLEEDDAYVVNAPEVSAVFPYPLVEEVEGLMNLTV